MNLSAGDTHRPNTSSSAFKKLTFLAQMKLIPWNVPPSQPHILAWETPTQFLEQSWNVTSSLALPWAGGCLEGARPSLAPGVRLSSSSHTPCRRFVDVSVTPTVCGRSEGRHPIQSSVPCHQPNGSLSFTEYRTGRVTDFVIYCFKLLFFALAIGYFNYLLMTLQGLDWGGLGGELFLFHVIWLRWLCWGWKIPHDSSWRRRKGWGLDGSLFLSSSKAFLQEAFL